MMEPSDNDDAFARLEAIVAADPGRRGIANLIVPGDLRRAAVSLAAGDSPARRVLVVTGFWVPTADACETDGPPGALAVGRALEQSGAEVRYVTDEPCSAIHAAMGCQPLWLHDDRLANRIADFSPTHAIAIERLGRAADGKYYTMRARDNSAHTAPLDRWFLEPPTGCVTIGIGDGGNEIGMGKVRAIVARDVALGDRIATVVATDFLIVAGVSNWGAWALAAGLALLHRNVKRLTPSDALEDLRTAVAAGAVDGVTGERADTVDGIAWDVHAKVIDALFRAA